MPTVVSVPTYCSCTGCRDVLLASPLHQYLVTRVMQHHPVVMLLLLLLREGACVACDATF